MSGATISARSSRKGEGNETEKDESWPSLKKKWGPLRSSLSLRKGKTSKKSQVEGGTHEGLFNKKGEVRRKDASYFHDTVRRECLNVKSIVTELVSMRPTGGEGEKRTSGRS